MSYVKLDWTYDTVANPINGFNIYRDGTLLTAVGSATRTYTDNSSTLDNIGYLFATYVVTAYTATDESTQCSSAVVPLLRIVTPPMTSTNTPTGYEVSTVLANIGTTTSGYLAFNQGSDTSGTTFTGGGKNYSQAWSLEFRITMPNSSTAINSVYYSLSQNITGYDGGLTQTFDKGIEIWGYSDSNGSNAVKLNSGGTPFAFNPLMPVDENENFDLGNNFSHKVYGFKIGGSLLQQGFTLGLSDIAFVGK